MLIIEHGRENVFQQKKKTFKSHKMFKMTSLIHQTQRNLFQQVCDYHRTRSGIDFPNCVLNFFLKLCNTSRSILVNYILEITP